MVYDDGQQVVHSVIFHGASLAWLSFRVFLQSWSCAVFSQVAEFLAWIFMWLCTTFTVRAGSTILYGEVVVVCSEYWVGVVAS